ncbi:tat pathway signal sequence [Colletotrichum higginsianum]|nr:tat pathway signal sequence [Colletotrichum higginsianum]
MLYTDQYASLSSNSPDCASDGEPEQYPLTSDGLQPRPPARKSRSRYTYAVLAVLAQLVYTILVLVAAREVYYKGVCPVVAAPDRYHAWDIDIEQDVLQYKEVPADHKEPDEHHPYLGAPRPELDQNWNTLLSSTKHLKLAWLR